MIDDEIRDALRVDPSPEFVARVRTRVGSEPAPSAWRWSWTFAAAGAVAAILLIAIVVPRPERNTMPAPRVSVELLTVPPKPLAQTPPSHLAPGSPSSVAHASPPSVAHASPPSVAHGFSRAISPTREPTLRQPELLVDARETAALRRLIAGVNNGTVDLTPLAKAAAPAPMDLDPVADIVIAPITIEPLAPLSGAEGVRP